MPHEVFRFRTSQELLNKADEMGLILPLDEDLSPLRAPIRVGPYTTPNALAVQPMEGCDGEADGPPGDLTRRRYLRFARGGAGLLWFEATAITADSRANPRQLWLHAGTVGSFARLRSAALSAGQSANGAGHTPVTILQLTHSGRYSRPADRPVPRLAHHDGVLDAVQGIGSDYPLMSDAELSSLPDRYAEAAVWAQEAGFVGVDIKCCHRYLLNELLAAHTRPGPYGGLFENRTRLLLDALRAVKAAAPNLLLAVRLNVYDGHPYPWGWGVDRQDARKPDLQEPLRLIGLLQKAGVAVVNVTAGNPYHTPHINRPFDRSVDGEAVPVEHPLEAVMRLIDLAHQVKASYPSLVIVGSGYSWLRHVLGYVAAGVLRRGWADIVGLGREAFAYPDFARDLLLMGGMDRGRCCLTCSRCTQIMRDGGPTGCVVFDREIYEPIYRQGRR